MGREIKLTDLPIVERDRVCRCRAVTLWQRVAAMPASWRYTILFELVKLWVERTPVDHLADLAADLRGRARRAEQRRDDLKGEKNA